MADQPLPPCKTCKTEPHLVHIDISSMRYTCRGWCWLGPVCSTDGEARAAWVDVMASCADLEAEVTRLKAALAKAILAGEGRVAPMQGHAPIAWAVHLRIWEAYHARYPGQSAERLAERGGFGAEEADMLYPAWRSEAEELPRLRIEVGRLRAERDEALAFSKAYNKSRTGLPPEGAGFEEP